LSPPVSPPPPKTETEAREQPATFEESIRTLGEIAQRLEAGDLSLEESLLAFEKGVALARAAKARLDAAEARVEELLGVDEQGRPTTRSLEAGRAADATRATNPDSPVARARSSAPAPAPAPTSSKPVGDDDDLPF
jgi:exodeoxyribonuclease VII small subunit